MSTGTLDTMNLLKVKRYGGTVDPLVDKALDKIRSSEKTAKTVQDDIRKKKLTTLVHAAAAALNGRRLEPRTRLVLHAAFWDAVEDALKSVSGPGDFEPEGFIVGVLGFLDEPRGPIQKFSDELAELVAKAEHISLSPATAAIKTKIREARHSLRPVTMRAELRKLMGEVKERGELEDRIKEWAAADGLEDAELDTGTVRHMRELWLRRGFKEPSAAEVAAGDYDEHFLTVYNEAARSRGAENDPIDRISGGGSGGASSPWNFTVETFDEVEEQGVESKNVLAAGAIDYIYELGERMGIFRLAEAMVLNWSAGSIDVAEDESAEMLYRYWKQLDRRSSAEERGMLYRRVLDKGGAKVLDRMVPNEHFSTLWHQLLSEVAEFIEKSEKVESGSSSSSPVKRSRIFQATKELQYNLTEYCTGMAHIQAEELYAQLSEAIAILRHEDIIAHFGGSKRKNMWTVIERLSKAEFGDSPPIGAIRSLAVDGNKIFQWIANFDQTAVTDDAFDEFVEAAETYILNRSLVDDVSLEPEDEDDFEEDFEEDFEDDFEEDAGDDEF